MIQNLLLGMYTTSQCSKLSSYLSPIHNGKLVIMFSNLGGTCRFSWEIKACRRSLCHYVTSVNIQKKSQLIGYITRENATGGRLFIDFSHSSWNNYIYHFDGRLFNSIQDYLYSAFCDGARITEDTNAEDR